MTTVISEPIVTEGAFSGQWALLVHCPICGEAYQHHGEVTVFERLCGEDGESHAYTVHDGDLGPTDANPSPRRDAMRINFWCEEGHMWWLDLIQHKGRSFVQAGWEDPHAPTDL